MRRRDGRACILLALAAGLLFVVDLGHPGFFDFEGRYADVGAAMLATRDWITPRLDGTLFLNKPPLLYWLTALAFGALGETEWARLVSVLAAVGGVAATAAVGVRRFGRDLGLVAGVALATMLGFANEARALRPDMLVTALVAAAVLAWTAAEDAATPGRRRAALVTLWTALGLGMLAKGLVPPIVAAMPIGVDCLRRHGVRGARRVAPALGAAVLVAIVLPWHVVVAIRHPGFAWDYVVNQHLLFFLDRKFPRDSEGIALVTFWLAFVLRAMPWIVLVPFARFDPLAVAWAVGPVLFFSLAPSRLEHYVMPALPGVALLAATAVMRLRASPAPAAAATLLGFGVAMMAGAVVAVLRLPTLLPTIAWLSPTPGLVDLVRPFAVVLFASGLGLVIATAWSSVGGAAAALGLAGALLALVMHRAQVILEPLLSWKPVAALVAAHAAPDTMVVYEAPEEYQLVAGLAFYTHRHIELLELPGFVPPTYLALPVEHLFLPHAGFVARWRSGAPTIFVSDFQQRRPVPEGLVPPPYQVLGRPGWRWVVSNQTTAYAAASR